MNTKKTDKKVWRQAKERAAHKLFSSLDFTEYLQELYTHLKAEFKPYSYIQFAEDLNFGASNNLLRLVITKKRKLTLKASNKIANELELSGGEKKAWLNLVIYAISKDDSERDEALQKIMDLKEAYFAESIDPNKLSYYREWHHAAIRELAGRSDFQMNPKWIQHQLEFELRLDEIKSSLELLTKLGLIYYNAELGRHTRSEEAVDTGDEASGVALIRFHQQMIDLGKQSLSRITKNRRAVTAATVTLSKDRFQELRKNVFKLIDQAMELDESAPDENCDTVQLNVQLFPLTKAKK